jgi:AraC-like DNA-binding protein
MQLALSALREEGATVGELADRLGYRSEAAFSRAFKRVIGVAPGAVRRARGEPRPASIAAPAG